MKIVIDEKIPYIKEALEELIPLVYVDTKEEFHEYTKDGAEFTNKDKIYYFYNIEEITKCKFGVVNAE